VHRIIIAYLYLAVHVATGQDMGYHPGKYPGRIIMSWNGMPETSRTITWWTDTTVTKAEIQWLVSDASSNLAEKAQNQPVTTRRAVVEGITAHFHTAHLKGLDPGSVYTYRVGKTDLWSEWFQFNTIDHEAPGLNFIYLGDAQNDMRSLWARTIRQAYTQSPKADFILHAGDMVDHSNENREWGEWFEAGGWIFASVPQVLVPGNHEYVRSSSGDSQRLCDYWRNSFTLPENGPPGLEETVYYLDYKNIRLIVLDSRDMLISEAHSKTQAQWLENILANNPKQWTIISHHHPIYSARGNRSGYDMARYLQPLYDKYKVDLVLQGHHHSFARGRKVEEVGQSKHEGPVYFVSNSGPKMYDTNFAGWMERVATDVQLYHIVNITGDRLTVKTYLVNGKLYDQIELVKNKDGSRQFREIKVEGVNERLDFSHATYGADIDTSEAYRVLYKKRALEYMKRRKARE